MMSALKNRIKFVLSVNWVKTLYFNFKMFPFEIAKKLPVFFYGKVKFSGLSGEIVIDAPIRRGMIGFGQPYEMTTQSKGISEITLWGKFVFKGHVQFGKDYFIYIGANAYCEFGHMASLASNGKVICMEKIILGNYARLGSESQIIDTNFHQMINTVTGEKWPISSSITIGDYNYIGNRVSIMQNTKTPAFFTIASNTLCNKDYTDLGKNVLIGGFPAKLVKENISRDWEGEKDMMESSLIFNYKKTTS
jgi:acetyltransferase-like isoleucine patch superfamily enzyme